mgnify:CR=1
EFISNDIINAFLAKSARISEIINLNWSCSKGKNISSYINDNINLSADLQKILTSDKILSLVCKLHKVKKENLIFNNPRFRVQ